MMIATQHDTSGTGEIERETSKEAGARLQTDPTPDLSDDQWKQLLIQYDHRCVGCGRPETEIDPDPTQGRRLLPNLILPARRGGTAHVENVQPMCPECHERKADQWVDFRPNWPGFYRTHRSLDEAQPPLGKARRLEAR